jgi:hypothetical protein
MLTDLIRPENGQKLLQLLGDVKEMLGLDDYAW